MKKISGGYLPINPNFVLSDLVVKKNISDNLSGIIAVAKNILFRGTPTNASPLIKNKYNFEKKYGGYCYFEETKELNWNLSIKGSIKSNPAMNFYEILKREIPNHFMYFLPECSVSYILNDNDISPDSAVDFYAPVFKLIIEIDGSQHNEHIHAATDGIRDDTFLKAGITTLRISTLNFDICVEEVLGKIKDKINNNTLFNNKKSGVKKIDTLSKDEIELLYIFRFQICILEMLEKGCLDLYSENFIQIKVAHEVDKEIFNLGMKDIIELITALYKLSNDDYVFQNINIELVEEFVGCDNCIDIDISNKYDESLENEQILYVRNDYFLYPIWGVQDAETNFPFFKNYYKVSFSDKRFNDVDIENKIHINSLKYLLKLIYDFDDFRPNQLKIIINGLKTNQSVVGLLPTGSGKSLCFQLISFLTPGISLAISPLTMLMEDQCRNLFERNKVTSMYYINASDKGRDNIFSFKNNNAKIIYISPERFFNDEFKKLIYDISNNISQIIIDEVHCLSEWGHDFRTAYLLLFNVLQNMNLKENTLLIGVSATSSPRVSTDIKNEFEKLKESCIFVRNKTTSRKELTFNIIKIDNEDERNKVITKRIDDNFSSNKKTLIFVPYRKDTSNLRNVLTRNIDNINVGIFQSTISANDKRDVLKKFKNGVYNTVVATKSFGMGLDVPDIRETIHSYFSSSVESMYQEMGRAGRDEKPSQCNVIFNTNKTFNKTIIDAFSDKNKFLSSSNFGKGELGELDKQFFLIKSSKRTPDVESKIALGVLNYSKDKTNFTLNEISKYVLNQVGVEINQIDLEQILFRLYTVGLVNLWGLNYKNGTTNPLFIDIIVKEISIDKLNFKLSSYINKYDTTFNKKCVNLVDVINTLCTWSHENFFDNKWNSLRTLYDFVYNFKSSNDFAERIDNYFSENILLERAVSNTNDYKYWLQVLDATENNVLVDQLSRYIEEYKNHMVVNFLSGITRLNINDFYSIDGEARLNDSLVQIKENKDINTKEFLIDVLKYINKENLVYFFVFLHEMHRDLFDLDVIQSFIISKLKQNQRDSLKKSISLKNLRNKLNKLKKLMEKE